MSTVNLRGKLIPLDSFIPVVPRGMFKRGAYEVPFPVAGVMINDILTKRVRSRHGYYYLPKDAGIDTEVLRIPIFRGKQVIRSPVVRTF